MVLAPRMSLEVLMAWVPPLLAPLKVLMVLVPLEGEGLGTV